MTTSLPTARLGWTDMHLTRVGFGAWAIGGGGWEFGWGPQRDDESIAAIHRALDLGVGVYEHVGGEHRAAHLAS